MMKKTFLTVLAGIGFSVFLFSSESGAAIYLSGNSGPTDGPRVASLNSPPGLSPDASSLPGDAGHYRPGFSGSEKPYVTVPEPQGLALVTGLLLLAWSYGRVYRRKKLAVCLKDRTRKGFVIGPAVAR